MATTCGERLSAGGLALLRLLPAELSHSWTLKALRLLHRMGLLALLTKKVPDVPVQFMGLEFPNPVGLAAGLDKDASALRALSALGAGFIEVGTVTPAPCSGNSGRRLRRLHREQALINRLGFPSAGLEAVAKALESFRHQNSRQILGANIGKHPATRADEAEQDYVLGMRRLWPFCDYFTVNLSSPNSPGLRSLQDASRLRPLLERLGEEKALLESEHGTQRPLLVKFAPDMTEENMAQAAAVIANSTVAGVVVGNTTLAHARPELGGLSGRPLACPARRLLEQFHSLLPKNLVRIACGGIDSGTEAQLRRNLGADLVQVYTGLIYRGPGLLCEIACAWQEAGSD